MPTTPDRQNVVLLDVATSVLQETQWADDLSETEIPSNTVEPSNVAYHSGVGWRLQEYQAELSAVHETSIADDAVISFTSGSVATGILAVPTYRTKPELTGVPTAGLRDGDNYLQKRVAAGSSFAATLTADQAAFPGPALATLMTMDRVAVAPTVQSPNRGMHWRIRFGSGAGSLEALATLYFVGMPGQLAADEYRGTGSYALVLYGDGLAILHEQVLSSPRTWVARRRMQWCPPNMVVGMEHHIGITSDTRLDAAGLWTGTHIIIRFPTYSIGNFAMVVAAMYDSTRGGAGEDLIYPIPQTISNAQPTLEPIRVDIRRDVRARFQVSYGKYKPSGTLTTKVRVAPAPLNDVATYPIYVTVIGTIPTGASLSLQLYKVNPDQSVYPRQTACTLVSTTSGLTWFQGAFTGFADATEYFAVVTFTSAAGTATPTVRKVTFYRQAVAAITAPTPLEIPTVSSMSIAGPDRDATHETAQYTAPDPGGDLAAKIGTRGNVPILHKLFYDPLDATAFTILFRGRAFISRFKRKGFKTVGTTYPRSKWGTYQIQCAGEWARLMEKKTIRRYSYGGPDPNDGQTPYLVTTVLRDLFQQAGLLTRQYELPTSSIRMFIEPGKEDSGIIEPYVEIFPIITQLARDYLGAYVMPDNNATNGGAANDELGCWRVRIPPSPDSVTGNYNYLCRFLQGRPAAVLGKRLTTDPLTYPDLAGVPQTFIRRGSLTKEVEPPDGNIVIVDGVSAGIEGSLAVNKNGILRIKLYNWKAIADGRVGGAHPAPDPTHPDYTTGEPCIIYYQDKNLQSEKAVSFIARRIFDLAGHAKNWRRFEAPLKLVDDTTDSLQIRFRKLQFGDAVLFEEDDGTMAPYFVGSVNLKTGEGQSKNSMAAYELFQIPALLPAWTASTDKQHVSVLGRETGMLAGSA